ncbi:virulence-associated E family protein [Mesorhizobium sp. C416B]|uniref:virulence-associated E family protein n=1 Tax=unclassified Mesorhizobium TaxID=325217 RepID=UPI0003CE42EE|nr:MULTISPECIES: virulence-associated E family protein [unclassified Mesorhizobium]ESX48816.1 virulence protein E [Mesorhizobium sp. LSHC426A00]ESX55552.1 virulence protein E [Mesorhizobium sp. LSHC424B00]ESX70293.1 virulence protein E [Mesorhizobium sp. LSHC416B00]WJI61675.1 virulence-associated E family protein [Mesorhizobium sp. C416B]
MGELMPILDGFEFNVVGEITADEMAAMTAEDWAQIDAWEKAQGKLSTAQSVSLVQMFAAQLAIKQGKDGGGSPSKEFSRTKNSNGTAPSLENAKLAIQKLGIVFRYNLFSQRVTVEGHDRLGVSMDDIVLQLRNVVLERLGFDPEPHHTRDAIRILALQNSFDPVREYLDVLVPKAGVNCLDTWLTDCLGAEDNELTRAFGRAVLIAAVRRVRRPGSKFDFVLVLEGPQGGGKSSALKILAGGEEYFSDEIVLGVSYKEQQELLQGKWIVELPELAGLKASDIRGLKQFVSKTHDRARPAFGRSVEEMPRRGVMIGTTNDAEYLRDMTGNRRFWPVVVGKIDLPKLREIRDQLWAEAAAAELEADDPITIPESLWAAAAERQAERVAGDPWETILADELPAYATQVGGELRIATQTVIEKVMKLDMREARRGDTARLAECMRRLGWTGPKVLWLNGADVRGYAKSVAG